MALFFLPLVAIELVTITLALTRPGVRVTRWPAAFSAAMFAIFTIWAMIGFSYPTDGLPLALNITSKVLAFAVALSLFVRGEQLHRFRHGQQSNPLRPAEE